MLAKIRFIKKFIINSIILRKFDLILRILIGIILEKIYYLLPKKKYEKNQKCLLLMIGGLGDSLFHKELIDNLIHNNFKIVIYIQKEYIDIFKEIYNHKNVHVNYYTFTSFLNIKQYSNYLYISTNATIESYIFYKLTKAKYIIGYSGSYKKIISNFKLTYKKNNTFLNKRQRLKSIIDILRNNNILTKRMYETQRNYSIKNIILFTFLKSNKWGEIGNLSTEFQIDLIKMISEKYKNHRLIYVGVIEQFDLVEDIKEKLLISNVSVENLCGKIDASNLLNLIKSAKKVFTIDGGLLHLADYFNKDVVAFFNFSSSDVYSPKNAYVVKSLTTCSPCKSENYYPIDGYPIKCPNSLRCSHEYDTQFIWDNVI